MGKRWISPVGIELTWIPKVAATKRAFNRAGEANLAVKNKYYQRFLGFLRGAGHYDIAARIRTDPGYTIELPTPIFKNKKAARRFWDIVEPLAQEEGLIKESELIVTGAGHLNVNAKDAMHTWKLLRDFAARPYIAWAFNDLADDEYAVNYFTKHCDDFAKEVLDKQNIDVVPMLDCTPRSKVPRKIHYGTAKYCALHIRGEYNHWLEFRPFSAARTWAEQEAHLDFIQAYMQWVDKNPIIEKMPFMSKKGMQEAFTADTAAAAFKQLIADLGLKWKRYAEYEDVLRHRFTMGLQYLC